MLLAAAAEHCLEEVAIIASALSVPDPRDRPADKQTQADQKHAPLRDEQSDFLSLLKLWRDYEKQQREQLSRAKLRGWCKENFLSYLRLTEWHDVHGQVMEVVKGELALKLNAQPGQYASIHRALLAGLLSQVAKRKRAGRVSRRQRHQARSSIRGRASSRRGRPGSSAPSRWRPPRCTRATSRASSRHGSSKPARTWSGVSTTNRTGNVAPRAPRFTNA